MAKYRKKSFVIEAIQFTGHNDKECLEFCQLARDPDDKKSRIIIPALEGDLTCDVGDYIIKDIMGEFYPCKPDIFHASYTLIEEPYEI